MTQEVETKAPQGASTETPAVARNPYVAPRIRRLGSVRELTFGSAPPFNDGGIGMGTAPAM